MNSRFRKLAVESLEGRSVLSTMVQADFNNDGLLDVAAITSPNTVTVSLANVAGGYTVSDVLSTEKNQPIVDIYYTQDFDGDGDRDIELLTSKPSGSYQFAAFRNNGDGTFDYVEPVKWHGPKLRGF
jgi:FG-GAP-like repeat